MLKKTFIISLALGAFATLAFAQADTAPTEDTYVAVALDLSTGKVGIGTGTHQEFADAQALENASARAVIVAHGVNQTTLVVISENEHEPVTFGYVTASGMGFQAGSMIEESLKGCRENLGLKNCRLVAIVGSR